MSPPLPFPIIEIDPQTVEDVEQLGSKTKFWFRHEGDRWLFKEPRLNTGEHWAEKIAAEVAVSLGVHAAVVELAVCAGRQGCAVRSFIHKRRREVLIHGNELLAGLVTGYQMNKRFQQSGHTLKNIIKAIQTVFAEGPQRETAGSQLAGYVVLDALIGNTDRHHENWGLLFRLLDSENKTLHTAVEIAPSFDHASSLGRELLDDERVRRCEDGTVLSYLKKGRGGIFGNAEDRHGLSPLAVACEATRVYPAYFQPWRERVANLDMLRIREIVAQVPDGWISDVARTFALTAMTSAREVLLSPTL